MSPQKLLSQAGILGLQAREDVKGGIEATLGWQETDTPDNPLTWSAVTSIGSALTVDGVIFGTTFTAISFTKKYVRFVVLGKNAALGTVIEACHCSMRIELRSV